MVQAARSGKQNIVEGSKASKTSKEMEIKLSTRKPQNFELYREFVETRPPETIANIAICLIHQTNYLLDQHVRRLEKDFLKEGGLRERMTRARIEALKNQG